MNPSAKPISGYLSYVLAAAHRRVNVSLNARLKKHRIQVEAWRVLEALETGERITMSELAEVVLMNPPTLTKLVDRMVADGLVHRQVAQQDHRQINLLPTALGRKRMVQVREEIETLDDKMAEEIGKNEARQLIQILQQFA